MTEKITNLTNKILGITRNELIATQDEAKNIEKLILDFVEDLLDNN